MNETQEADFKRLTPAMKRIICSGGMSTNNWSGVVGQDIRPALILEERGFIRTSKMHPDEVWTLGYKLTKLGRKAADKLGAYPIKSWREIKTDAEAKRRLAMVTPPWFVSGNEQR